MSAPAKTPARKTAAKKTSASRSRVRSQDTDATRDAVDRAAEQARDDQTRASLQAEQNDSPKIATVNQVEEFASGLSDNFLECRDGGHKYKYTDYKPVGRSGAFSRRKFCPNCKFDIDQDFDRNGMLVSQKPRYPEGYLAPKGSGRVDRYGKGRMRVESFQRALAKSNEGNATATPAKKAPAKKTTTRKK